MKLYKHGSKRMKAKKKRRREVNVAKRRECVREDEKREISRKDEKENKTPD